MLVKMASPQTRGERGLKSVAGADLQSVPKSRKPKARIINPRQRWDLTPNPFYKREGLINLLAKSPSLLGATLYTHLLNMLIYKLLKGGC
jgi:hypothetical protein